MHIFDEPKIDCHAHVIDPAHFPYGKNIAYKTRRTEIGTTAQFRRVMSCYGVKHALLVQPNSGYEGDNSCLLDAIAKGEGRFKGIAIVDLDAGVTALKNLQTQGIIGVAINPTFHGNEYYRDTAGLMKRLADLDMFLDLQVENDQFLMYEPWIASIPVKVLIDHVGRPTPPGRPRPAVLCSHSSIGRHGTSKPEAFRLPEIRPLTPYPFEDCWPFVRALVDAFTLDHCMWASDWPYLRAQERQDYGPLVQQAGELFPNAWIGANFSGRRQLACSNSRPKTNDGKSLDEVETSLSGYELLNEPLLNKGTAFTEAEQDKFDLHGLLPPHVSQLDYQVQRHDLEALRTSYRHAKVHVPARTAGLQQSCSTQC